MTGTRTIFLYASVFAAAAALGVADVRAHVLHHPRNPTLTQRIAFERRVIHHDGYVLRWYERHADRTLQATKMWVMGHTLSPSRTLIRMTLPDRRARARAWRDVNFHQRQMRRFRRLLAANTAKLRAARIAAMLPPHYTSWLCIHHYEGSWTDDGGPYYGGLQFGYHEWHVYGTPYTHVDTANLAAPLDQMWAAERYYRVAGFAPWPNTARFCGLL